MEIINDKRVEKTFSRLRVAFTMLMMEKNFDEITVFDLCKEANVQRATFYTHFKDKMDFTAFTIRCVHKELGEAVQATINTGDPIDFLIRYIECGVAFISSKESIYEHVSESESFPAICTIIADCTRESLAANIEAARKIGLKLPADLDTTVTFVNAGLTYTVLNWLRKRPPPSDSLFNELRSLLSKIFENE
jgi:AcrR family transcriptional regulator